MALALFGIVFCGVFILVDIYLAIGWISPDLSIRIDQKLRKFLHKSPIIILDPCISDKETLNGSFGSLLYPMWLFLQSGLL